MICDFKSGWYVDGLGVIDKRNHIRIDFFTDKHVLVGAAIKEQYREIYKPTKDSKWYNQSSVKKQIIKYQALYLGFADLPPIEIPLEASEITKAQDMRDYLNDVIDEFEGN